MFAIELPPTLKSLLPKIHATDVMGSTPANRSPRTSSLFEMVFDDFEEDELENRLDGITRSVERAGVRVVDRSVQEKHLLSGADIFAGTLIIDLSGADLARFSDFVESYSGMVDMYFAPYHLEADAIHA